MRISALACLLLAASALAQPTPRGDEEQLNSHTPTHQLGPRIARSDNGFVVVWSSDSSPGTDLDESIVGRRFNADGGPIGGDFQINSFTTGDPSHPSIDSAADGSFVVVWSCSYCSSGTDTSETSIQGRRFASDATPIGEEFQINTYTSFSQRSPSVAVADDGTFVVAWTSERYAVSFVVDIRARHFATNGKPTLDDFKLNDSPLDNTNIFPIAAANAESFVVVWSGCLSCGNDQNFDVKARRLAPDGAPVGASFRINTATVSNQFGADVDFDAAGNFVVVWRNSPSYENYSYQILVRKFSADGTAIDQELRVDEAPEAVNSLPSLAVETGGEFLVVWHSDTSSGNDSIDRAILQQVFDAEGLSVGANFQVNTYTTDDQAWPDVAVDSHGRFIVAWHSLGSTGDDASGRSIQGRRFFNGIFADSFESGDLTGWTSTNNL